MLEFLRNGDLSRFWQVPVVVVLAGLGASANAESQKIPAQIRQVSVESGLPGPIVTAIVQDQQGFLWVGTRSGLGRFDGSVVTAFQPDLTDPSAFPPGPIRGLIVTRDDAVWAAIEGSGRSDWPPSRASSSEPDQSVRVVFVGTTSFFGRKFWNENE